MLLLLVCLSRGAPEADGPKDEIERLFRERRAARRHRQDRTNRSDPFAGAVVIEGRYFGPNAHLYNSPNAADAPAKNEQTPVPFKENPKPDAGATIRRPAPANKIPAPANRIPAPDRVTREKVDSSDVTAMPVRDDDHPEGDRDDFRVGGGGDDIRLRPQATPVVIRGPHFGPNAHLYNTVNAGDDRPPQKTRIVFEGRRIDGAHRHPDDRDWHNEGERDRMPLHKDDPERTPILIQGRHFGPNAHLYNTVDAASGADDRGLRNWDRAAPPQTPVVIRGRHFGPNAHLYNRDTDDKLHAPVDHEHKAADGNNKTKKTLHDFAAVTDSQSKRAAVSQPHGADDENAPEKTAEDQPAEEVQPSQADGDDSHSPDLYEDDPGPRVQDLDDDEDKREVAKPSDDQDAANDPPPDDEPNQPPEEEPVWIRGILPRYCVVDSECVVVVQFSPESARVAFCKFGRVIVRGSVKSDLRLHCKAPRHQAGQVNVSISRNGLHFFGAAVFTFERRGWLSLWIIGAAVAVVVGLVGSAWIRRRATPKKRRRKTGAPAPAAKTEKEPVITRRQSLEIV